MRIWATDEDVARLKDAAKFWDEPYVKALLVLRDRLLASGRWRLDDVTVADIADVPALWAERALWFPEFFA